MSTEPEIITVTAQDPRVIAFHRAKDAELEPRYQKFYESQPLVKERVEGTLEPDTIRCTLLALIAGEPVGTVMLRKLPERFEVKRLVVDQRFRSKGIAKMLMARIEDEARALGADMLFLHTGKLQPDAIGLYESQGWSQMADLFPPYAEDGVSMCFSKPLY